MNPFKYLNEINYGKRNIMVDEETEKAYVPFIINRSLSYFPDTVALANEMNRYGHLESRLQFAFLINTIRKRKRFSKWIKPEIENDDSEKFYQAYSMAAPRLNVSAYAQDGAGQSLGLAYQMMYNRFNGFMGFGNRYNYHNPYYYGGNYYGYD